MIFIGVCLTFNYDHSCSETDFTQEKSHCHPTTRILNSSLLFAAALSLNGRIAVREAQRARKKNLMPLTMT